MDYKGAVIYISAILAGNINEILQSSLLIGNLIYIGYQIHLIHKKNKEE